MRWCADFDFSIEIEGYADVKRGAGGSDYRFKVTSGTFAEIKSYKYSILANGKINDPELEVKP
ncbi:hypothetical protein D3C83_308980 [compost metagenome]